MNDTLVKISLRLSEVKRRRFRILALQQGLTAEQALGQAVDTWIVRAAMGDRAPAALSCSSAKGKRAAGGGKPQARPTKASAPPSRAAAQPSRPAKGDAPSWSIQALQLDWSQCPAAERVDTKQGKRWVFRGTRVPLADLFYNLERGHSVEEIVAHYKGLKDELVNNVMQFAGRRMHIPGL